VGDVSEGRRQWRPRSAKALAQIERRIGLGPRHSYQILLDLARPWVVPVPLIRLIGAVYDRDFPASPPEETDCRLTHAGRAALSAEAGQLGPVPLGIINGTLWRGGTQPPLEPYRVLRLLRSLAASPRLSDREILDAIGGPYSAAGCDVTGDLDALAAGQRITLRETGRITITGAAVPPAETRTPEIDNDLSRVVAVSGPRQPELAHVVIESLPATADLADTCREISSRLSQPKRDDPTRERSSERGRPISDLWLESTIFEPVHIAIRLSPGYEPAAVRQQLAEIEGVYVETSVAFSAPLPRILRTWIRSHHAEDVTASLTELETAIDQDRP